MTPALWCVSWSEAGRIVMSRASESRMKPMAVLGAIGMNFVP